MMISLFTIVIQLFFCFSVSSQTASSNRFKRIDYEYDLVSGKVNKVSYQKDSADQFIHQYSYDSDNRITKVETSSDNVVWDVDAKYFYYAHGPLARTEIGNDKVQGIDYAYTLQGWIKGVNSNTLDKKRDMGQDGKDTSIYDSSNPQLHANFAQDAFGYSLNYFKGDYKAISQVRWNNATNRFEAVTTGSDLMASRHDLHNGNISSMVTTIVKPTITPGDTMQFVPLPQGTAYKYDQLNRLVEMKAWQNLNSVNNTWGTGLTYNGMYNNKFSYDANGNILTALAKNQSGQTIDDQTYHQQTLAGKKVRNRTYAITDLATQTSGNDLLNQTPFDNNDATINTNNNYSFTEIGERKSDKQDSIDLIIWTAYGKIKEVKRTPGCAKMNVRFSYDPQGNTLSKHLFKSDDTTWISSEYYIRDGQGNLMNVYEKKIISNSLSYALIETNIYGNGLIGVDKTEKQMIGSSFLLIQSNTTHLIGKKDYTGDNHLGNVLVTFTDKKLPIDVDNDNIIDHYFPEVVAANDYSPFGSLLTERTFNKGDYPNSFNGKRNIEGLNFQDYGMRIYNPMERIFPSVDPISHDYPYLSTYQFAGNNSIAGVDLDGLEFFYAADGSYLGKIGTSTQVRVLDENKLKINAAKTLIKLANNFKVTSEGAAPYLDKFSHDLGIKHDVFLAFGSLVDQESSGGKQESYAIANVTMNFIKDGGSSDLKTIEDVSMYDNTFAQGAVESKYQEFKKKTPQERNAKYAISAVINALGASKGIKGYSDNTNGADGWDGIDLISTKWDNAHREYSWSESSKDMVSKYKKDNNGGVDVAKWTYKKSGYDIEATKIIGKTLFTNLKTGRGEHKEGAKTKFK